MKYSCKQCGAELSPDMTKECPCLAKRCNTSDDMGEPTQLAPPSLAKKSSWSSFINRTLRKYIQDMEAGRPTYTEDDDDAGME